MKSIDGGGGMKLEEGLDKPVSHEDYINLEI